MDLLILYTLKPRQMKKPLFKWMMTVTLFSFVIASCGKDDDEPGTGNEEELITTLEVNATETGTSNVSQFIFRDIDGPGGANPNRFDSIVLKANRNYAISLRFLNESVSPAENITAEVVAEANDHQVYYEPATITVTALNLNPDGVGLPLGTTCAWNTGVAGKGSLKITLKHKPGVKQAGDPVSKGETDIEVNFGVRLN
jgi:hypothetical protein